MLPPLREKSFATVEGLAVFFNGNGGGMSGSSTTLPFLLGTMGGTSYISGSLLSIDSNNKISHIKVMSRGTLVKDQKSGKLRSYDNTNNLLLQSFRF